MDLKTYITSIQDKLLSTFRIPREEVEKQVAEFNVEDSNLPSRKHFKYLHQAMVVIRSLLAMEDYFEVYKKNPKMNTATVVIAKKIHKLNNLVHECRHRYKATCKSLHGLADSSFIYSAVLVALVCQKCWMYYARRYDLLMRTLHIIYRDPKSPRSLHLFGLCLMKDEIETITSRYGYLIMVEQNKHIDYMSTNVLIGNDFRGSTDDMLQRDVVDYLSTSNLLDTFTMNANSRTTNSSRMPYTKNFENQSQLLEDSDPTPHYFHPSFADTRRVPEMEDFNEINFEPVIEELITEINTTSEIRSMFQESNVSFCHLLNGYLMSYEGYASMNNRLKDSPNIRRV